MFGINCRELSFFAHHIALFGNTEKGFISHLLPATYEDLICLMGKSVSEKIDDEAIFFKLFLGHNQFYARYNIIMANEV